MSQSKNESLSDEVLLTAKRFRVVRKSQRLPSGQIYQREIVCHPGSVAIVPILDDGRICLIRNFRLSVGKWLIEVPAGTREPNEPLLVTAARELTEETGYIAGQLKPLIEFFPAPGILDERMIIYVATQLRMGNTAREEGELMENLLVTFDEARDLIATGQIDDAKTIIGLSTLNFEHQASNSP